MLFDAFLPVCGCVVRTDVEKESLSVVPFRIRGEASAFSMQASVMAGSLLYCDPILYIHGRLFFEDEPFLYEDDYPNFFQSVVNRRQKLINQVIHTFTKLTSIFEN